MKKYVLTYAMIIALSQLLLAQPGKGYKPIVLDPNYNHTKWTIEPKDLMYEFAAFTCSFDSNDDNDGDDVGEAWGIPEWVAYEIKATPNQTESGKRPSKWLTDTQRNAEGIVPKDNTYAVPGTRDIKEVKTNYRYVRGHMCMKKIASRVSLDAEYNTHTTLNAVPQLQWQNAGIWLNLEFQTIEWAEKNDGIWVICGPVFFKKRPAVWLGQEGEVKAAVPDALYKIVIKEVDGSPQALAFIIPNVLPADKKEFEEYLTSINRIEELTGLDFLANINDEAMEDKNADLSADQKIVAVRSW